MSRPEEKLQSEAQNLIKEVPVEKLEMLIEFMEFLIQKKNLRTLEEHLTNPVYDDEPESEAERVAVNEAKEDIKEGRFYRLEDVARELNVCPEDK